MKKLTNIFIILALTLPVASVQTIAQDYFDMQFIDSSHGWLISDQGMICNWDSENGSWHKLRKIGTRLRAVCFKNNKKGFVCGESDFYCGLDYTTDGGKNWALHEFSAFCGMQGFDDVAVSEKYVWVLASSICIIEPGVAYLQLCRTEIQGDSLAPFTEIWRKRGQISSIAIQPPFKKWVAGALYGLSPRPSNNCGVIYYNNQEDGSGEWTIQYLDSVDYSYLYSLAFADSLHGWACGRNGNILATKNGGALWEPQESGIVLDLWDVHFVNKNVGWIVGDQGTILHTIDGGARWKMQRSDTNADLLTVAAVSPNMAWVGGSNNVLMQTLNGGKWWGPSVVTSVDAAKDPTRLYDFTLEQNYPNPFNSQTTITFELDKPAFVELNIFDITGRHVQTLMSQSKTAGRHAVTWDAANSPSGIYLCELRVGEKSVRRKIVLQK